MHKLLEPYAALVPFLGVALGDNVEVALHDLTSPEQEVVAIANGEISGREVGAKLSNLSVHYLETKQYEKSDYVMNYKTAGPDGKLLKSATYWIKEPGNVYPVGMLCINVNVTDFEYIETAMRRILGIKDNTFYSLSSFVMVNKDHLLMITSNNLETRDSTYYLIIQVNNRI